MATHGEDFDYDVFRQNVLEDVVDPVVVSVFYGCHLLFVLEVNAWGDIRFGITVWGDY